MRKILLVAITIAILLALKVPPPVSAFVGWAHDGTGCKVGITGTASTGTCSLTVSHVGDTLVAACDAASLSNTCSISDSANSGGSPWTLIASCSMGRAIGEIYSTVATSASATTVTATWSAGLTGTLFADSFQYTGGTPPAPTNANSGTPFCSTTATSGNITNAGVNSLAIGYGDISTTLSAGTGYTACCGGQATNGVTRTLMEYNATSNAGGTIAVSFTAGGTAHGMMGVALPSQVSANPTMPPTIIGSLIR
jgi:hypothetical protein